MAAPEIIPNPDPSSVTQQAIDRALGNSAGIINARISGIEKQVEGYQADLTRVPTSVDRAILGLREILETRFDGIDHDLGGVHSAVDKRESAITAQIVHLRDLLISKIQELSAVTGERFVGVAAQFTERDTRTDQRAGDTKLAVDAAFAAAKETTAKTETNFTKQIDAMISIIDTKTSNLANNISDIKDRMTAVENRTVGINSARIDSRAEGVDSRGNLAIVVAAAAVFVSVLLHFIK